MKLNKFFLGLLGLSAMVMTSCSDSDDYQWASITGGDQVYFSNTLPTTRNLSMSETKFIVPVTRVTTTNATTVNISLTSDDNFLTAPSSVSFPAGASTADIEITYDPEALGYDNFKNAVLKITDESQTNAYGNFTYSFSAGIPSPYKSLGKGSITDNFWFEATASVTIMQNTQNPNEFRIMTPFEGLAKAAGASLDGNQEPYIQLTLLKPGDTFYNVTVTKNDLVGYTDLCTGYFYSSYEADVYMLFPGRFTSMASEDFWGYNKVVEWQENGLPGRIQLAPYFYMFGVGGWNNTQADGVVVIDFPGYAPKDLSAEMDYLGVLTDPAGAANAAINLTLGADVADARAIVVSADADADAVADAIAAGDVEAMAVTAGTNYVPISEGLTGKLMVVLAIFDEGNLKNVATATFEYYGGGANPWEVFAQGDYVYTQFFGDEDDPYTDAGLEVQYNAEEDAYRITHWGYDVDFTFTWNKETNECHVPSQFTGYTHSSYGDVYVAEANDLNPEWGVPSSSYDPETRTFSFGVAYYVSAGVFGAGVETFTLTPAQARRLGLDKKSLKVSSSLKISSKKSHARNSAVTSREQIID